MKVNGNARPFIFDTGGRTALTTKALSSTTNNSNRLYEGDRCE